MKKEIYCYETKQKFKSIAEAAKFAKVSPPAIGSKIDNPYKAAGGYHWCSDLSIFDGLVLTSGHPTTSVYCYETKKKFDSITEASKFIGLVSHNPISNILNDPTKTSGGFHWCTELSIFDDKKLVYHDRGNKTVYCYETKQKFKSIAEAARFVNVEKSAISLRLNKPNLTSAGYHWCTDLSIFDGVKLTNGQGREIYCYETKQGFGSIKDAAEFFNVTPPSVGSVVNNPTSTSGGYHFCTDLSVFDGVELSGGCEKVIYCYETKQKFPSIGYAAKVLGLKSQSSIGIVLNNPRATAGNYHWCTDLSIFDGIDLIYYDSGVSGKEKEVTDFIESIYLGEIVENSRKVITPKELDIFIPEKNLAVEFNGIYWHSEKYLDKNYHIDKTNLCKDKGIQLIHIFEHQWLDKSEIFKSVIANKLGLSQKIYARKCKVVELSNVSVFLDENHLQGNCPSSIKLGLVYDNELVSVMTFVKPRFNKDCQYELLRFCNKLNTTVIGGASKLLKYFEKNYNPKSIISYANLQWSNGNVYRNLGFEHLNTSDPNYWWVRDEVMLTRYQCQKHKLRVLLKDKFDPSLSEKENMEKAGYSRLFDCGNMVFVKNYG